MNTTNRLGAAFALAFLFSASLTLFGCSSSPDKAQMNQLNDLKEEVASLKKDVAARESQTTALEKEVADKNAKLKNCNDNQQIVRQRLEK
jgi:outer membrane murein-binding lipoprotein Lpp